MKKRNYIFVSIMILIILIGDVTLIREQKIISGSENRTLQQFEHFTLKSYLAGIYQDKLESALSDQFIGSETIKINLKSKFKIFSYDNIPKDICTNRYLKLDNYYANFNCGDYLLYQYEKNSEELELALKNRIYNLNTINKHIDTYYYFLSTSKHFNFEVDAYSIDVIKLLQENLEKEKDFSTLEFENYDQYVNYFYKTDHHWNHIGSYQAYKDIIYMFNKKAKILEPIEEIVFDDIIFYGSLARYSQIVDYKEIFRAYKFDLPDMEIITNKNVIGYGSEEDYFKGIFNTGKFANHYGLYYGDDFAEVSIEANSGKRNLLIISNSYSNSVNKLIATHFNKTYDIDLRHYESTFNKEFDIKEYVEENDIDKVLFIMDYTFLTNEKFDLKWGE